LNRKVEAQDIDARLAEKSELRRINGLLYECGKALLLFGG
jgi:hypothetical protein